VGDYRLFGPHFNPVAGQIEVRLWDGGGGWEPLADGRRICGSIIERHQGKLWAAQNKGRGAIFSFSLPRDDQPRTGRQSG
jgi:hypothetical protein